MKRDTKMIFNLCVAENLFFKSFFRGKEEYKREKKRGEKKNQDIKRTYKVKQEA